MIVTFRPEFEASTNIMSKYIETSLKELGIKPESVIDLRSNKAVRKQLIPVLNYYRPDVIIAEGHGRRTIFTGQEFDKVFWVGDDAVILLSGSRVYLMSCWAGSSLAEYMSAKGVKLVAGYTKPFLFVYIPDREMTEEPNVWFYEPQKYIIKAVIDGKPPKEVFRDAVKYYMKSIRNARKSFSLWTPVSISSLINDLSVFRVIGDGKDYRYSEVPAVKRAVKKDWMTLLLGSLIVMATASST